MFEFSGTPIPNANGLYIPNIPKGAYIICSQKKGLGFPVQICNRNDATNPFISQISAAPAHIYVRRVRLELQFVS